MSDYLVYWKEFWSDAGGDPSASFPFHWHTAKKSFFRDVEEHDCLWVVVTGGKNYPHEWRLLEHLVVRTKRVNDEDERPFEIVGNDGASQRFDIKNQVDFGPQLRTLEFASGKKLVVSGAAIGNALQAIRRLASSDVALLNEYSRGIDKLLPRPHSSAVVPRSSLTEFFRQASFYRYHPAFQEWEREYKIQLANALAKSRDLVTTDPSGSLQALVQAIKSEDDNIIDWRDRNELLGWLKQEPLSAIKSLRSLWDDSRDLYQRLVLFSETLAGAGLTKPGAQLAITSTFLMAFSAEVFPPVKVDSFYRAMKLAGWDSLYKAKNAADRYMIAQSFMDEMVAKSATFSVELRDRLDVQGVVWCVSGGWKKHKVPPDWINDPEKREAAEQSEYVNELRELEDEPETDNLSPTDKLALVRARRGQGKFREALVRYWDCCAVTQCGALGLLVASHIKPWKPSNNRERLDHFNGLLLSPNLDRAFDSGLITFEDSGRIKISKQVTAKDKRALGINSKLRLCKPSPKHAKYLKYHREEVFKDKQAHTLPSLL